MKKTHLFLIIFSCYMCTAYPMMTLLKRSPIKHSSLFVRGVQKKYFSLDNDAGIKTRNLDNMYERTMGLYSIKCSEMATDLHGIKQCSKEGCPRGAFTYCKSIEANQRAYRIRDEYLAAINNLGNEKNNQGDLLARLKKIALDHTKLYDLNREFLQSLHVSKEERNWKEYKNILNLLHHKAECLSDEVCIIEWDVRQNKKYKDEEICNLIASIRKKAQEEYAWVKEHYPQYPLLAFVVFAYHNNHSIRYALQGIKEDYFIFSTLKE